MTSDEFVRAIEESVYQSAVEGTISVLSSPPGRQPSRTLVELSKWFNDLSVDDKERVRAVIATAARHAVFGMLTILDGARAIRKRGEELGSLELRYVTSQQSDVLNCSSEV